jgi:hypothetical protein
MLHCHNGDIGLFVHIMLHACMDSLAQFCWVFEVDALSSIKGVYAEHFFLFQVCTLYPRIYCTSKFIYCPISCFSFE